MIRRNLLSIFGLILLGTVAAAFLTTVQAWSEETQKQQPPSVKPGSKDDVSAIGNRDIGSGKGLGNWYSLEREISMGREYAQQIEASAKLLQDPIINEYVNRVGQNLVETPMPEFRSRSRSSTPVKLTPSLFRADSST